MNNEPNKPAELTEKELAGIAGGAALTEIFAKMAEVKKGGECVTAVGSYVDSHVIATAVSKVEESFLCQ